MIAPSVIKFQHQSFHLRKHMPMCFAFYLGTEETELLCLTDSSLKKLRNMSDAEYAELDLFPDFDDGAE